MPLPEQAFVGAIQKLLAEQVEKIASEEAAEASKRIEKRVKEEAARIALQVASWHRMEVRGSELVITVNIPQRNST
jgi:hypothetical protein